MPPDAAASAAAIAAAAQEIVPPFSPDWWLSLAFWRDIVFGCGRVNLSGWLSLALLLVAAVILCLPPVQRRLRHTTGELFLGLARAQFCYFACTVVIFGVVYGSFGCCHPPGVGYARLWLMGVGGPVLIALAVEIVACAALVACVGWRTRTLLRLDGWGLLGLAAVLADACFTVGIVLVPLLLPPMP